MFQLKKLHVCGNYLTVHYFRYMIQKKNIISTCESVLRRSFYVLIDNKSKYRGMALNRHRIKPEKTINELKKPNHILFLHNNVP